MQWNIFEPFSSGNGCIMKNVYLCAYFQAIFRENCSVSGCSSIFLSMNLSSGAFNLPPLPLSDCFNKVNHTLKNKNAVDQAAANTVCDETMFKIGCQKR